MGKPERNIKLTNLVEDGKIVLKRNIEEILLVS
jgi:hypothetical protein